jgi:hypothetical protein
MAGGNFDDSQHLNGGRVEWPRGPLLLLNNEEALWIQAWIVQASTGSAQTCFGTRKSGAFAQAGYWTANRNQYNRGAFQQGFAVGIALLWTRIGPSGGTLQPKYFWWSGDPIQVN